MTLGRLAAEDWLGGRLPWWNPYTGVGLPLAAEMQPAAFFLPFVLLLHFAHGVLYLKIALQLLAGLTMLGFLRALGLMGWAACLGAVLFQLGGTFAWYGDAPYFPIAFLPLLLWGLERTCRLVAQGRRGGEAWLALAIGGSLLAGFPETAFADGLLGLWLGRAADGQAGAAARPGVRASGGGRRAGRPRARRARDAALPWRSAHRVARAARVFRRRPPGAPIRGGPAVPSRVRADRPRL